MTDISIAAVLEHYGATVSVAETGWRSMRCPFHDDRTASASVNLELNAFACHACDARGDAVKLIETQENLGFVDAIEFARSVLGQSVEEVSRPAKKRQRKQARWSKGLFD